MNDMKPWNENRSVKEDKVDFVLKEISGIRDRASNLSGRFIDKDSWGTL